VGQPILVKASYFPNWKADGARGPWRIGPNLMVVVPTEEHVTLTYGYTVVDYLGWAIAIASLAGLVLLWRWGPVALPEPRPWFGRADPADFGDTGGPDDGPGGGGAGGGGPPDDGGGAGAPDEAPPDVSPAPPPPPDPKVPAAAFDPAEVILGGIATPSGDESGTPRQGGAHDGA
jgi:hypothetical protein